MDDMQNASQPQTFAVSSDRVEIYGPVPMSSINPETIRLHNLSTVPVNEQTMSALQELVESEETGRVHVINGAAIFLTDAEFAFHETEGTLEPENFDTLGEWRDHLRGHIAEMDAETRETNFEIALAEEPTGEDMLSGLPVVDTILPGLWHGEVM